MTRPAIYPPAPEDDEVIAEVHDACGTAPCTCPGSFLSESEACKRCGQSSRMPGKRFCEWCTRERVWLGGVAHTLRMYAGWARRHGDTVMAEGLLETASELVDWEVGR